MFLSAAAGVLIALPALLGELFRRGKNLPILMDVHACWGRPCTAEETFLLSLATHLLISIAFGGLYMFLALLGWGFHDFTLLSLVRYGVGFWLVVGGILLPLSRLGFFGRREGRWVWLELLISQALLTVGFWASLRLFPVFLP